LLQIIEQSNSRFLHFAPSLNASNQSFQIAQRLRIPPGRTVPAALALLGAGLFVELGMLGFSLLRNNPRAATHGHSASEAPHPPEPSLLIEPRLEAPEIRSAWQELVERSRAAAAKGETDAAIGLLEEAEAQVPQQPASLAEIAVQFEKCSAPARAVKLWERIYQFGISAGVYYSAADAKLSLIYARAAESGTAESTLGLGKIGPLRFGKFGLKELPHSVGARRLFVLSVPLQKTATEEILVRDVSIQVLFYDQINGASGTTLERTNATRNWKWAAPPVDWRDESFETLDIEYRQNAQPKTASEERRYFGYVASLYYQDKLVDSRSEPPRLGQQYPPPRLLSKEAAP
jgi:hypothetical protein